MKSAAATSKPRTATATRVIAFGCGILVITTVSLLAILLPRIFNRSSNPGSSQSSEYPEWESVSPPEGDIKNWICEYYKEGGSENECSLGDTFQDAWIKCVVEGADKCMGIMWSVCDYDEEAGYESNASKGAWKLITAGQVMGSRTYPSSTCSFDLSFQWDVYLREVSIIPLPAARVRDASCDFYASGGNATSCEQGDSFESAWAQCIQDGGDQCMGVMWNSCKGANSDTGVLGAWRLLSAGQTVGNAYYPSETCGGAGGEFDAFLVNQTELPGLPDGAYCLGHCEECANGTWNNINCGPRRTTCDRPGCCNAYKCSNFGGDSCSCSP